MAQDFNRRLREEQDEQYRAALEADRAAEAQREAAAAQQALAAREAAETEARLRCVLHNPGRWKIPQSRKTEKSAVPGNGKVRSPRKRKSSQSREMENSAALSSVLLRNSGRRALFLHMAVGACACMQPPGRFPIVDVPALSCIMPYSGNRMPQAENMLP